MYHTEKNQKGVSLLFIVLITGLILAIALGICAILIQEVKLMSEIGYSVTAFYSADSGVEETLYSLYQTSSPSAEIEGDIEDVHYYAFARCCNPGFEYCAFGGLEELECPLGVGYIDSQCDARNYCLKSLGSYRETKRAIEVNY